MSTEGRADFTAGFESDDVGTAQGAADVLLLDNELIEPGAAHAVEPMGFIGKADPFIRIAPAQGRSPRTVTSASGERQFEIAKPAARDEGHVPVQVSEVMSDSWQSHHPIRTFELEVELEDARSQAAAARLSEERSKVALYRAVSSAYDFSLLAAAAPDDFAAVLAKGGIIPQQRAPMVAVVKLVFGGGYDKTRLSEYAAALELAHRRSLPKGGLLDFLLTEPGGLKGVVALERALRKGAPMLQRHERTSPRAAIVRALRAMPTRTLDDFVATDDEFTLMLVRRMSDGALVCVDQVPRNVAFLEKAASEILAQAKT
ncbi:MAG: hypothetical protein KGM49_15330 [Sphingomonadales bacterium]|nr:hypothetical protein [Sphingomonadales bacterium]